MRTRDSRDHDAWRWWLLAGAGWGLAVTTRFQVAVFGLPAVCVLARRLWVSRPDFVAGAAGFLLGAAPLLLLQAWAWRVVYGEWLVFGYGAEGEAYHWSRPELCNSLFSSWHGLFYWHPFLLVAGAGATCWCWRGRAEALAWTLPVIVTAYVSAAWWCWWFASAFGNRSYDAALLPFMAGAGWLFRRARPRWRRMLWVAAIAAGAWNFYVAMLYRTGAIARQEPVTWSDMIDAAPRVPSAARF
jgi:hypothetical protein